MNVFVTFVGGWGHAEPLLPLAAVAASRRHRVTFAGQAAVMPRLARLGFETVVVGPDTLATERQPLVAVDREMERVVVREHFVTEFGTYRAAALSALFARERPRLVICDEMDVGAVVAAELMEIPCVTVIVIAAGRLTSPVVVGEPWNGLRSEHGLASDPDVVRIGGTVTLSPAPRSFRDPELPSRSNLHDVRPPILDRASPAPTRSRPFVYVTLGTVFNMESGDLLDRLVGAMALVDADVLVTTGPNIEPGELPDVASHVRIEHFVPQHEVMAGCRAVVCHGGSGTLVAALSLGVPVVVLPMGADQPDNADRCEELGVGVVLDPITAEPRSIADAVDTVLADEMYSRAATVLATEAAQQPRAHELVEVGALFDQP